MKLSANKCRITGVILTEVKIGVMTSPGLMIQARFALIDEESNVIAEAPLREFSKEVETAIDGLVKALEGDAMKRIFGEEYQPSDESAVASPKDIPTF